MHDTFLHKNEVVFITIFFTGDSTAKGCSEVNLYLQPSEASYYSLYSKVKSMSLSTRWEVSLSASFFIAGCNDNAMVMIMSKHS